ncbi:MAG: T9SS type A sorting domain-containing protein, partial [Bacteroidota bacterium]
KNDIAGKDTVVDFYLELTAPDTIGSSNIIQFKLDANKIPSVLATAISGTKVKDILINYFLSDIENDNLNIKVEYTKNNEANWSVATTTGKLTNITSSQYGGSVNWQTLKDIPDSANVKIRIRVYDNDEGIYWTSGTFKIDNSKIVSITLIDVAETVSGDIKINYLIKDLGNQIVQFSPEYSLNGGNTFKKILGFSGDTSNITPQKYSGTFIWKSRLDIPFTDTNNVVVRFTPRNSYGEGYSDSTNIFTIDNLPPLFSGVQNLIPDSAKVTVNWNIATDKRGPIYYKVYIKKEGDLIFNIADSVQGITSVVVSKLGNFAKYSFNVLSFDALGNCDSNSVVLSAVPGYAPTIKLFTLLPNDTSLVTDTLKFNYNINADNLDTVRYKFEYSKNGGTNWSEARPEALVNEFLNKNINSTFLWLSKKDIPFVENNELLVRITPKGRSGDGNAMLSKKIKVDNAPPQFLGLQNVVADTSGGILILNWFTAQDVNGPIKYFIYVKQNDTNGIYAQVPRITLNTFDTLRDLKNFTKYFIAVRSADSVGNIDLNNNIISASPGKPVNVISLTSPIKASRDTVKFVYSLYSANGDSITLSAEYSLDGGFYWNKVKGLKGKISGITIPNYSDTLLWVSSLDTTNIETREAKFRLIPKGLAAMRGKDSITKKFNLDSQGPKFPGIFFIGSNQKTLAGSIILAWPRANDLNAPVNYLVYISQISNVYNRDSILKQLPQDTLQYIFSGLKGATTYYFNIWAVDSLGNIDKDTVEKSITLSMLGDFTLDGYLTSADLAEFVNGWKIQNTAIADIYPDSGALPYTISKPDGRIDVRDLTLFLYIWNWAYDNNKGGNLISKYNPKNYAQTTNNENAPVKLFGTSAKSFNVNLNKVKNLDVLSLTLSYNQNNLKIDSIKLGAIWSSNAILWKRINHEIGKTEVAVLNFSKDDLSRLNSNEAIEIYYTSKNKDEKIQYAFELYYLKNNSILNGSGKYEFTKTEILPKEFTLSQNYPNPFNGSTLISFALPEASKVKIILYSLLGEVIETIVENEFIAGVHQTQFNTQLATGVYYYKFEAVSLTNPKNKIVDTKKMVLIK